MTTGKPKRFRATLVRTRPLNWVVINLPLDVQKIWGTRGQLRVAGEINGVPFRTTLFPKGDGTHTMVVNRALQKKAGIAAGQVAKFILQPDETPRKLTIPVELKQALSEEKILLSYFSTLNQSSRADICRWVSEIKNVESRTRRAYQLAERLMETMEAESELPPMIRLAFSRDPVAWEGWQKMTSLQRRGHLLGIFYYRTPGGRARRLEKAMLAAREHQQKHRTLD